MKIYLSDGNPNGHILNCNSIQINSKEGFIEVDDCDKPSLNELPIAISKIFKIED